ncbi:MAG: biotin/lipoyl-binding protein [Planctomycetes bacterium]|nr:biotin/lipoyl-binding protein [Planctomycetota bacterium]
MTKNRTPLKLPELGMGEIPITVSLWLVEPGERVIEGDRVVEILAGAATVDLPAPTSGVLVEVLVDEDDRVKAGQTLGYIEPEDKM